MPHPPQPAPSANCPDLHCQAPIGAPHHHDCLIAICVSTGHQRILHATDEYAATHSAPLNPDTPIDAHTCGADVWAGHPHGATTAATAGLFARRATAADAPLTGWIPCPPDEPGAVPDIDRLVRSGTWNRTGQIWELPAEVTGRG